MAKKPVRRNRSEEFRASFGVNASVPEPVTPVGGLDHHRTADKTDNGEKEMPKLKNTGSQLEDITTKTGYMNAIMSSLSKLRKEDVKKIAKSLSEVEDEDDEDEKKESRKLKSLKMRREADDDDVKVYDKDSEDEKKESHRLNRFEADEDEDDEDEKKESRRVRREADDEDEDEDEKKEANDFWDDEDEDEDEKKESRRVRREADDEDEDEDEKKESRRVRREADDEDEDEDEKKESRRTKKTRRLRKEDGKAPEDDPIDPPTAVNPKDKVAEADDDEDEDDFPNLKKEDLVVNYDILGLFEGTNLSIDFKKKVNSMFESAILATVNENLHTIECRLRKEDRKKLNRKVAKVYEEIDKYLSYVAEQYVKDNKLAIENGLKVEQADSFMKGMQRLFETHYISIPAGKENMVNKLMKKVDRLEETLGKEIRKQMSLTEELESMKKFYVVSEIGAVSKMTDTTFERLCKLAENVDYINDKDFKEKVSGLAKTLGSNFVLNEEDNRSSSISIDDLVKEICK